MEQMLVEDDECVVVYVKLGGIEEKNTKDKDDSQFCEIIHISSPLRKKRKFSLIVSSSDEESDDSDVSIDVENSEESSDSSESNDSDDSDDSDSSDDSDFSDSVGNSKYKYI